MAVVKKIPATETGRGVLCKTRSGQEYKVTQNPLAQPDKRHTLWKVVSGGFEKICSAGSPYDLYPKIKWEE